MEFMLLYLLQMIAVAAGFNRLYYFQYYQPNPTRLELERQADLLGLIGAVVFTSFIMTCYASWQTDGTIFVAFLVAYFGTAFLIWLRTKQFFAPS